MAYINPEKGYQFPSQSDLPWTQSFRMTLRAPAIANRVFDTLAHAQAYIDDYSPKASAVPGIILVVTSDSTEENNGVWEVLTIKESASGAAGTMRRIDERSVVNVSNISTDLEKFKEAGIYLIKNTTTNKGYVLFVEIDSQTGNIIQSLSSPGNYQTRTGTTTTVEGETTISWSIWSVKKFAEEVHTHTTDDVKIAGDEDKTLTERLAEMQLMIYAGLA